MLTARLFEDIVLLEMMTKVPTSLAKNSLAASSTQRSGASRHLTLQQESDISDSFAFISATSEHPGRVLAVCLEELEEPQQGMILRFAMNTPNLEPIQRDLAEMVKTLEKAARHGSTTRILLGPEAENAQRSRVRKPS